MRVVRWLSSWLELGGVLEGVSAPYGGHEGYDEDGS